jgi:hypothetical protein
MDDLLSFLKDSVDYDPETGVFRWKKERPLEHFSSETYRKAWASQYGSRKLNAGDNGYVYVQLNYLGRKKRVRAHRLAWALVHGTWPTDQIDHINGDRADNRIVNLRVVTNAENGRNRKLSKNNSSGYNGIYKIKRSNSFHVEIHYNNRRIFLGQFKKLEDAIRARKKANLKYGYAKNHGLPR